MSEFISTVREAALVAPWLITVFVALFGACLGSFYNVVIYRVPQGKSVVRPGSTCSCGAPVQWRDNIPVLSWIMRRGRARCCGSKFSFRYCAVEFATAALFVACWVLFSPGKAVCGWVLVSGLIIGSMIDWDHMEIPDFVTIGLAVAGVTLSLAFPALHGAETGRAVVDNVQSLITSLEGIFIGSGVVLWFIIVLEAVLKKEVMGFGDVKLLGAIGAFGGWTGAVFALGAGAILGILWVGGVLLWKRITGRDAVVAPRGETPEGDPSDIGLGVHFPFGPMLSAAGAIHFLFLRPHVEAFFALQL